MPLIPDTNAGSKRPTPRLLTHLRTILRVVAAALAGFVLVLLLVLLLLQLPLVAGPVAQFALSLANPWEGTTATVSSAGGTWLTELSLRELRISSPDGSLVIGVDSLGATYDLAALTHGELRFKTIRLVRPVVVTGTTPEGELEFLRPFSGGPETEPDTSEGLRISGGSFAVSLGAFFLHSAADSNGPTVDVSNILITARDVSIGRTISLILDTLSAVYRPRPDALEDVQVDLAGTLAGDVITVRALQARSPWTNLLASGTISLPLDTLFTQDTTSFRLDANPIAYRDLHPFVSTFGPEGEAFVQVSVTRSSRHAEASAAGTFHGGGSFKATGSAEAGDGGMPSVQAEVRTDDVSIDAFTGRADTAEDFTAHARVSGHGASPESFTGSLTAELDARGIVGSRALRASVEASLAEGSADLQCRGNLDALHFDLRGRIKPLSDPPAYNLTTSVVIPPDRVVGEPDDIVDRLSGLSATISASGTGFNPLTGTNRTVVRSEWEGHPHLKSLLLEASTGDSSGVAKGVLTTAAGFLRVDAQAKFGAVEEFALHTLEFSRLDPSPLLGTAGTASITGSGSGFVRGTDPATMTGTFSVRLDSSRVGTTRIARGEIDTRLENGVVTASLNGETSDGAIRVRASAEPFAQHPSLTVPTAEFVGLDLGGLFLDEDGATDLNGSARLSVVLEPAPGTGPGAARGASKPQQGLVGTVQVDLGESRIYTQKIVSASVVGELTGQTAAVEFDLRTPEGGAFLSGSTEPFREFPNIRLTEGRLEHLDIGAIAGIETLDTDISGTFSAELQGESWETASATMTLDLLPSRINREPIHEARVSGDLDRGVASLKGFATLLTGSLNVVASGTYLNDRISFNADADIDLRDLSRLTRDIALTGSDARVTLAAEGVWGAPDVTRLGARIAASGRLDSLRLDRLVTDFSVVGRTILVDSLLVRSNAGVIKGAGTIALFDTTGLTASDFMLTGSLASLDRLKRISGLEFSTTGTAQLSASLTGTGRAGTLNLSTAIVNLGVEDILIPGLRAQGSARLGVGPSLGTLTADVVATDLAIGELVFDSVTASAKTEGNVSSFQSSFNLESGEEVVVAGAAEQFEDRYAVTLDTFTLNMGDRIWTLEDRARIVAGRGITIDGFSIASGPRRISAHGVLDPEGQQNFALQVDSLAFDRLARLLGRPELGGELSFSGLVTGPALDARATGRLEAHITSGSVTIGRIESDAEWTGGLAKVTSIVTQPDESQLRAIISLPVSLPIVSGNSPSTPSADSTAVDSHREFALQTDGFDLKFLEPFLGSDAVTGLKGLLTADISLRGTGQGLSGTGRLGVDSGAVRANSIGVEYSDIQLRASMDGTDLVIDTLSARTGEGGMRASGTVSFASPETPAFDLLSRQEKFVGINTQTTRAVVDGSVRLEGTMLRPVITGDITVYEANFVVPENVGEGQVEDVELTDADYAILRERFGYRRPAPGNSRAADTMSVSLDVALRFPRRSWIRKKSNPSLSVEIEGDLKVRSKPGEPLSIVGTLKPVPGRSYVSQFGRQFEIKSGEIRFDGPPDQFNMNVDSEYKVPARSGSGMSEATIRMRVERKLERFEFNLSSDPPMEQADILSYLTTGTATTGAFASTSSQGNLATSAALEQVVGAIGGLADDKIPLDIFQIRQDGSRGITIVAGNYVSPQTYLGVRYPILLQQSSRDSYYDTGTEFEVEYQATPWLFLNAKGGGSRLLLLLKSRYAY